MDFPWKILATGFLYKDDHDNRNNVIDKHLIVLNPMKTSRYFDTSGRQTVRVSVVVIPTRTSPVQQAVPQAALTLEAPMKYSDSWWQGDSANTSKVAGVQ